MALIVPRTYIIRIYLYQILINGNISLYHIQHTAYRVIRNVGTCYKPKNLIVMSVKKNIVGTYFFFILLFILIYIWTTCLITSIGKMGNIRLRFCLYTACTLLLYPLLLIFLANGPVLTAILDHTASALWTCIIAILLFYHQ